MMRDCSLIQDCYDQVRSDDNRLTCGLVEQDIGDDVLDMRLDGAAERSCTIARVGALADDLLTHLGRDGDIISHDRRTRQQSAEFDIHDTRQGVVLERMEEDNGIEPVDELRREGAVERLGEYSLRGTCIECRRLKTYASTLLCQLPRADIGGEDDDRVAEINGVSLPVGESSFVEDLQQDIEDIRVRLLNLVEEDDRVRFASHGFGEPSAFLMRNVSRRCADHERGGMFLGILGHIESHECVF